MTHLIRANLILSFLATPVFADTIVDLSDSDGGHTRFLSDGNKGRMNTSDDGSYMIVDYSDQSIKVVMPDRQEVMDLSGDMPSMGMPGGSSPEKVNIEIRALGNGPEIAGYPTKQYSLSANGEHCGTVFGSKEAMNDSGLSDMFRAMQTMAEKQSKAMGGMASMMGNCEQAEMKLADHVNTIGAPMRSIDANGSIEDEVTSINTDATLPADTFAIPSNYTVVNMQQKMNETQSEMRKGMQQYMPEMQQMMEQMKQNGQMNPQMQQQIQQMMQQYQQ